MKLSIKKSKIIVPALGLLLLSTAASVSGTVAWFTANRTFNTTVGTFEVTKLDGDLACTMAAGVGTSKNDSTGAIEVKTSGVANKMGDASFDHTSQKVYTDNPDVTNESGINTTSFLDKGTASEANWKVSNNVYYAVQWTMNFSYTFGADASSQGLFFDKNDSSTTNSSKDSDKAFRIAFIATDTIVWAPEQNAASQKYVHATSGESALASYGTELLCKDTSTTKAVDGTTATTSHLEYLGSFTTSSTTIQVTCVAWFDGQYLFNNSTLASLSASLHFYTRRLA